MLKKLGVFALAGALLSSSALLSAKDLRVATNPTYAPFEMVDSSTGKIVGFEVDLMEAMGKLTGNTIQWVNMDFDGIIPAVTTDMVDMAASGFSINEKRKKKVDFLQPFFESGLAIIINKDNDGKIKGMADLKGKKVAVQMGTIGHDKAKEIPDVKITAFNQVGEAMMELANNGVDAVINSAPATAYMISVNPKLMKHTELLPDLLNHGQTAMVVPKGNKALADEMNKALSTLKANGTYSAIYKKWFKTEPPANLLK